MEFDRENRRAKKKSNAGIDDATVTYVPDVDFKSYPKEIRDRVNTIKNFTYGNTFIDKSKHATRGMFTGGLVGLSYALYKRKNLLGGAFFGSVAGIFLGYLYGEYIAGKDDSDE